MDFIKALGEIALRPSETLSFDMRRDEFLFMLSDGSGEDRVTAAHRLLRIELTAHINLGHYVVDCLREKIAAKQKEPAPGRARG